MLVRPMWDARNGLSLRCNRRSATASTLERTAAGALVHVAANAAAGSTHVELRRDDDAPAPAVARLVRTGERSFDLAIERDLDAHDRTGRRAWEIVLPDEAGASWHVTWTARPAVLAEHLGDGLWLVTRPDACLRLLHDPGVLAVSSMEVVDDDGPALRAERTDAAPADDLSGIDLVGQRERSSAGSSDLTADGTVTAVLPLAARATFSDGSRTLPSGTYTVMGRTSAGDAPARVLPTCTGRFGVVEPLGPCTVRLSRRRDVAAVDLMPPLRVEEMGLFHQLRLRSQLASQPAPALDGTFFESWYGRNASDSPLALYREMAARGVGAPYTWSVADRSVEAPDGARAVVVGTAEWWEAATSARTVVKNCWLRRTALKREGQVIVQTWHGTPLKLLGLDRPARRGNDESLVNIQADTALWDLLLSQNPHCTDVLRRAYAWDRPLLEGGYPRNDVLVTDDGSRRAAVRARLGLDPGVAAVLYAPTWREDDRSTVGVLDVEAFAARLGDGFTVLARGHSNVVKHAAPVAGASVLDVTAYPDAADLVLASDLLVTDYSSIMFDFSVTGRPIVFYVPDLDDYAAAIDDDVREAPSAKWRGMYLDLASIAPSPLVTTEEGLVEAVLERRDGVPEHEREAYAAWQARFNPQDDGRASARAVDAILELLGDS